MKRRIFTIRSKDVLKRLVEFLEAQPDKPALEVAVYDHKQDRTVLQNSLYWVWITIIANEMGLTKEDTHEDLKKRKLIPFKLPLELANSIPFYYLQHILKQLSWEYSNLYSFIKVTDSHKSHLATIFCLESLMAMTLPPSCVTFSRVYIATLPDPETVTFFPLKLFFLLLSISSTK